MHGYVVALVLISVKLAFGNFVIGCRMGRAPFIVVVWLEPSPPIGSGIDDARPFQIRFFELDAFPTDFGRCSCGEACGRRAEN